ncbi:hypothetical protein PoB_001289300 [Plakobranchus ocellatus]|uniref:Uncharacterized protein n=1 Tax=Plakobranchus ocellatus TaxID=259542 RepID=A0AAV3YUZ6_9GAST|nr:hypothetical protein PoB_001289300 [Plakobranchus ocellatus]
MDDRATYEINCDRSDMDDRATYEINCDRSDMDDRATYEINCDRSDMDDRATYEINSSPQRVISGFEAIRQARAPVVGLEPKQKGPYRFQGRFAFHCATDAP